MRRPTFVVLLVCVLSPCLSARAEVIMFQTHSTATQMIDATALGVTFPLASHGLQEFTLDTTTHAASVTSDFYGNDFPDLANPGGHDTYHLYNTVTTGTVTQEPSGSYDITFKLLFELRVTSGAFTGLTFQTLDDATFSATNLPTLPFPAGTQFFDPGGSDAVNLYVKFDPTNTFAAGTRIGDSYDRLVTPTSFVPEPSIPVLSAVALVLSALARARKRRPG